MASEIKVDTIVNAGGDNDTGIDLATNDQVKVKIAGTNMMTIKEDGELELGTTSSSDSEISFLAATNGSSRINFGDSGDADIGVIQYEHDGNAMVFKVNASERFRCDSSGNVLIGTTTTSAATEPGVILNKDGLLHMNNSTTSSGISLILLYSSQSSTDQTKFEVTSEGNVKSRTNSYAGFSDERLKEQIVDASSQWDDIKAIEIKNFKFISNLDDADNPKMLGVIAQQVEKVSPSLVEVDPKDDMKTVKYSLLYLKAVKALQEAMARIETLEAKVKELESK